MQHKVLNVKADNHSIYDLKKKQPSGKNTLEEMVKRCLKICVSIDLDLQADCKHLCLARFQLKIQLK